MPGSNGFVFDTEEEYLENIKKLRKDNKLREEFSINARNYSENFSSSKYAKRVLDVYEKAIKDYKNFKNKYIEEIIG